MYYTLNLIFPTLKPHFKGLNKGAAQLLVKS